MVKKLNYTTKAHRSDLGLILRIQRDAIITLYEQAERNKIYNISSEFEQSNLETVTKIINAYFLGSIKRNVPDIEKHLDLSFNRPGQDVRYAISCEPLRELQWRPKKVFDEEIINLVKHYKKDLFGNESIYYRY